MRIDDTDRRLLRRLLADPGLSAGALAELAGVEDVVMMGRYGRLGLTRRPRPTDRDAVASALARVELGGLADRPIGTLSGGQRKRTFVARALVATHDLHALPTLADEAILLLGRVLLHAPTAEVLKPENLARAFGLGTEREGDLA